MGDAPSAKITSSGKSANTGPRCGASASSARPTISSTIVFGSVIVIAFLVIGASTGTWSNSCSEPAPQRACGARPPSTMRGEPLKWAVVTALMPLVTPGPAVRTATPGRRVSLAMPSAAKVAVCSWRTSTMRTSCFTAAS